MSVHEYKQSSYLTTQSFTPLFVLLDVFPSEKVIVSREILSGSYSASAYFVSRVIAELPLQVLLTGEYCVLVVCGMNSSCFLLVENSSCRRHLP